MNNPEGYVRSMQLQYRDAREVIEEFAEEFKAMDGRIIDIGCGPGTVLKDLLLPKVGGNAIVVGADISEAMLDYAKEHHANEKRLSFIELDIETSDLPTNLIAQFHHATAFYCLNWCRNIEVAAGNIYKLLQPGGKAIAMLNSYHIVFDFYLEQQKDPKFSAYMQDALKYFPPHYGYPNPEEKLRRQSEGAGLKVLQWSNRRKVFVYETIDLMLDILMAVNPFLHRMPEDVSKEYRKDMEMRTRNDLRQRIKNENSDETTVDDHYTSLVALFEKPRNEISF
ncbi:juvenile hormone acid O-methyltransferase [Diachasma alloeum]|uniref:juvenile hormone acid O-methyltransferase n=1 Tax=Diachasma alloeum TaxID=454923 RepID=UPI0007383A71|nr:juvenile hormone acid O-methyltransferase [Diachasma alloeum]